jgi:hypothetical protein
MRTRRVESGVPPCREDGACRHLTQRTVCGFDGLATVACCCGQRWRVPWDDAPGVALRHALNPNVGDPTAKRPEPADVPFEAIERSAFVLAHMGPAPTRRVSGSNSPSAVEPRGRVGESGTSECRPSGFRESGRGSSYTTSSPIIGRGRVELPRRERAAAQARVEPALDGATEPAAPRGPRPGAAAPRARRLQGVAPRQRRAARRRGAGGLKPDDAPNARVETPTEGSYTRRVHAEGAATGGRNDHERNGSRNDQVEPRRPRPRPSPRDETPRRRVGVLGRKLNRRDNRRTRRSPRRERVR